MAGSNETERTLNLSKRSEQSGASPALALLLGILLVLGGCTSATNFSGATAPLPTGQTGSLSPLVAAPGNCYIQDAATSTCSSPYKGSFGVTAVAAVTYGSTPTNAVFLGDNNGNIYDANVSSGAPNTVNTFITSIGSPILSIAVIPGTNTPGTVFYSTTTGVSSVTASSLTTHSSGPADVAASSLLTYSGATTPHEIVGMTTTGSYFTCTTTSCTSPTAIPVGALSSPPV